MSNYKPASPEFRVIDPLKSGKPYFLLDVYPKGGGQLFEYQWVKKEKVRAYSQVILSNSGEAISLPGLPFGGIWTDGMIKTDELEQFIGELIEDLRKKSCVSLSLIQSPKPYEPLAPLIDSILHKVGFVQESVQSHQFFMGKKKIKNIAEDFKEKSKLAKKEPDLSVFMGKILNFNFLQEIKKWNSERGYQVTFDESRLIQQVSEFPERYSQISILHKNKPVAHALAVKLVPESLYYFLSAIYPGAKVSNLGDRIIQSLFRLASEQKAEFIDLGSSETNGGINHSLMFFKSRFSNDISNKVTWKLRF